MVENWGLGSERVEASGFRIWCSREIAKNIQNSRFRPQHAVAPAPH